MTTMLRSLALAALLTAASTARAQTAFRLDFESLASPVTVTDIQSIAGNLDPRLANNGMAVFTSAASASQGFASWGNSPSDPLGGYDNYTGSTAIFSSSPNLQVNIGPLSTPNSVFSLSSLDIAPLFAPSVLGLSTIPSFQVQFSGRSFGSATFFTQTFTIPASNGRPTYTRLNFDARFTGLTQVAFFNRGIVNNATCTADQCTFQFDNVVGVLVTTPEPGTLALMVTGLVGVAGLARRRRNVAV